MSSDERRKASLAIVLAYRIEQLISDLDDIEAKVSATPHVDIDPLIKARALAALEAARRPLDLFLMGEGEELTPVM